MEADVVKLYDMIIRRGQITILEKVKLHEKME